MPKVEVLRTCPELPTRPQLKGSLNVGDRSCTLKCEECGARSVFAAYNENGVSIDPLQSNGVAVGTCNITGQHFTTPL